MKLSTLLEDHPIAMLLRRRTKLSVLPRPIVKNDIKIVYFVQLISLVISYTNTFVFLLFDPFGLSAHILD